MERSDYALIRGDMPNRARKAPSSVRSAELEVHEALLQWNTLPPVELLQPPDGEHRALTYHPETRTALSVASPLYRIQGAM